MKIDKIKVDIVKIIKHVENVTFVEIEKYFEKIGFKYKGKMVICRYHENIVIWDGWNSKACRIIHELLESNLIKMTPTDELIYYVDGKILTLPIYRGKRPFKQWLPVEFN
jgi:pathogenicity island protein